MCPFLLSDSKEVALKKIEAILAQSRLELFRKLIFKIADIHTFEAGPDISTERPAIFSLEPS